MYREGYYVKRLWITSRQKEYDTKIIVYITTIYILHCIMINLDSKAFLRLGKYIVVFYITFNNTIFVVNQS